MRDKILQLMLDSPDRVQKQLAEAISLIGRTDFPAKWPQLLPTLAQELVLFLFCTQSFSLYTSMCFIKVNGYLIIILIESVLRWGKL